MKDAHLPELKLTAEMAPAKATVSSKDDD